MSPVRQSIASTEMAVFRPTVSTACTMTDGTKILPQKGSATLRV